jgi:glutamate N-acetyltransferase / amino-acid N-acetyltransferase
VVTKPQTFFRSRWVERPPHVTELDRDRLPARFRAAGVACGIKRSGDRDVGLLVCDATEPVSAASFTRNALVAAPVTVARRADLAQLRAVVVNSGNANVSNGEAGIAVAQAMVATAARVLDVDEASVGVASTGVIGLELERTPVLDGVEAAGAALDTGAGEFAQAILTTDRWPKYATLSVELSGGPVVLAAQAKGGGMISPSLATMLCFVETDAAIGPPLSRLLESAIERSFNSISVDGQMSTNDSVFAIASGGSEVGVEAGSDDERLFAAALVALLKQLALEIVADGEGATRVARIVVRGPAGSTEPVARSVANSPLVKCALHGADPNWGRIVAAAGQVLPDAGDVGFDLSIEGIEVARGSDAVRLDEASHRKLEEAMRAPEVEMLLSFGTDEENEIYFCDLSHEYVDINSEYS